MAATATPPGYTALADPFLAGVAAGWKVIDASRLSRDLTLDADVVIIGTGAGGGTTAEILSAAGLKVVLVEEGPLATSSDFHMREPEAYSQLYQESSARKSKDRSINILQGRCVGGSTTVNWTSSFRTPPATLEHWAREFGVEGFGVADLAPWFERMEQRLGIAPWLVAPNENNNALRRGATVLGIPTGEIRRNVKGCWNLGYCGMGCPTNAKQSMLVTTIPAALARGATLVTRARALTIAHANGHAAAVECVAMDASGADTTRRRISVRATTFVVAGGAIGSPALLLRSKVPDPHAILGKRTFLHPTVVSAALMPERVDGYSGAPQSIYSDHFLEVPTDGPLGYKLEAPPLHPILVATTLPGHGIEHANWMRQLANMHVLIALMRDGFHARSPGGAVSLNGDGSPVLDYRLDDFFWDGARRALASMAEIQFAAGARSVMPVHAPVNSYSSAGAAKAAIAEMELGPLKTSVVSAHVMGGCAFGPDPKRAVTDPTGRHHQLENVYVMDGSLFPTSIGANPQLSVYGITAKLATALATRLGARRLG